MIQKADHHELRHLFNVNVNVNVQVKVKVEVEGVGVGRRLACV